MGSLSDTDKSHRVPNLQGAQGDGVPSMVGVWRHGAGYRQPVAVSVVRLVFASETIRNTVLGRLLWWFESG